MEHVAENKETNVEEKSKKAEIFSKTIAIKARTKQYFDSRTTKNTRPDRKINDK